MNIPKSILTPFGYTGIPSIINSVADEIHRTLKQRYQEAVDSGDTINPLDMEIILSLIATAFGASEARCIYGGINTMSGGFLSMYAVEYFIGGKRHLTVIEETPDAKP